MCLRSGCRTALCLIQDIPCCTAFHCCSVILDRVPASSCQGPPINTHSTPKSSHCRGHSRRVSFRSLPLHARHTCSVHLTAICFYSSHENLSKTDLRTETPENSVLYVFPLSLASGSSLFLLHDSVTMLFFEYALPVAAASFLFVSRLLLYPQRPTFTLKTFETLFLYWWQGVSVLKHLRVCFIILGSVTLSAPTVHEVLGGNPNACCRFIINTHLRQPYQARQENDNSFLCISFFICRLFWGQKIALCAFTNGNNIFFLILTSKDKVKIKFLPRYCAISFLDICTRAKTREVVSLFRQTLELFSPSELFTSIIQFDHLASRLSPPHLSYLL